MKHTNSTILFSKKVFVFPLIFVYTFFISANSVHAGAWGETFAAISWKQVAEEIRMNIRGAVTGAFKQAVGQIMNTRISMMIGGGGGQGPMFIANWETFLVADPVREANTYLNDFFSMSTEGRNSTSNYRPANGTVVSGSTCSNGSRTGKYDGSVCTLDMPGKAAAVLTPSQRSWFAQEGIVSTANAASLSTSTGNTSSLTGPSSVNGVAINQNSQSPTGSNIKNANSLTGASGGGNYYKDMTDAAKKVINPNMPKLKLPNYGSPESAFAGDWRSLGSVIDDKKYPLEVKTLYQNKLAEEQNKAAIQAIAYQGFKAATSKDGTVKTPGITIGALVNKVQGFNFDTISSAQDWGQLISSGVSAAATMAINTAVQVGLNAATSAVQSGVDKVSGAVSNATGGMVNVGLSSGSGGSLANVDWNNSGSGQSTEFNAIGIPMNGQASNAIGVSLGGQDSYSTLSGSNFSASLSNPPIDQGSVKSFTPNTTWTSTGITPQSTDSVWAPDMAKIKQNWLSN